MANVPPDVNRPTIATNNQIDQNDAYLTRLQKLIPVEVTGAYYAISKIAGGDAQGANLVALFVLAFVIVLVMYLHYLKSFQNVNGSVQKVVICISFLIWITALDLNNATNFMQYYIFDTSIPVKDILNEKIVAMILVVWTFCTPMFFRSRPNVGG